IVTATVSLPLCVVAAVSWPGLARSSTTGGAGGLQVVTSRDAGITIRIRSRTNQTIASQRWPRPPARWPGAGQGAQDQSCGVSHSDNLAGLCRTILPMGMGLGCFCHRIITTEAAENHGGA